MDTDTDDSIEHTEVPTISEWAILEETDSMSSEEFIAYMANLQTDSQKVLLNVESVISTCVLYNDLKGKLDELIESNQGVSSQIEKLLEENSILKTKNNDLSAKIKANIKDTTALKDKINEQQQVIDLAYQTVEDKTREFAEKQKELADSQVKVAELSRKFEQFRSSSFNLNHLINSQRNSKDLTGLGYNEVPPPFNENYITLKENEDTSLSVIPLESNMDKSVESGIADLKLDEHAKSEGESTPNTLKRKVQFVSAGTLGGDDTTTSKGKAVEAAPTPPVTESETTEKSKGKKVKTKSRSQRSCFTCHEKGHVASCCPNKKQQCEYRPVNKDKSPAKTSVGAGSSNGSPLKPILKSENKNISGINKSGLGYMSNNQSRFVSPKMVRPNSTSPNKRRIVNQTSTNVFSRLQTTPQRFITPSRSVNRFQNVSNRENYRESRVSHQGRNYRETPSSSNSNPRRENSNSGSSNQMENGYLKEFTFTDEKGQSKTVTAWVPRDN